MAFNEILKLKKQKEEAGKNKAEYTRTLIIGKDLFAAKLFLSVNEVSDENSLTFLSPEKVETMRDLQWMGPSRTRGVNSELLSSIMGESDQNQSTSAIFFKEGKFHKFGSRAKSSPLLTGEDYFKADTVRVDENALYPELNTEEIEEKLLEAIINCPIVSIQYTDSPDDLVEPRHWEVCLSDGRVFQATNLYWGLHPFMFIDLLKEKESLNRELIEFFQNMRTKAQLSVEFNLSSDDFDDAEKTWFLPLSQTHDWGHFIGDFFKIESENEQDQSKFVARFVHFLDEKEVNEDDVAKKLRILRRNFEKILDKKKDILGEEYVRFEEYSDCQNINDEEFGKIKFPFKNIQLFGNNAPLANKGTENESFEDSMFSSTHFLRGALTTNSILKNLS